MPRPPTGFAVQSGSWLLHYALLGRRSPRGTYGVYLSP